jgi:hypothetical protein
MHRLAVPHLTVRKIFFESLGAAVGLLLGYVLVLALVAVLVWLARG